MREIDVIILEYLDEIYPSREPPAVIYHNIMVRSEEFGVEDRVRNGSFAKNTLRNHLDTLEENGYIMKEENTEGFRYITDSGRKFVRTDQK